MKFKQYLEEEYLGQMEGYFWNNNTSSIFKNPSKKELKECGTDIRFIVDFKNKNLYTWNGGVLIHNEVAKWLSNEGELESSGLGSHSWWNWYYAGIAKLSMGKLKFFRHSDYLENGQYGIDLNDSEWIDEKETWTKTWFTESLIDSIKEYGW